MAAPRFDAAAALPKSILKKINAPPAQQPSPPVQPDAQSARDRRNREIALYHAQLIQQQKEVEAQILDAIVELIDFPSSPDADPTRPSPTDASQFKSLITNFQPSDYDSLLEERKCAVKCGYALCPRAPKVDANGGKKKFIVKGRQLQVVDREKLELWCSDDCARRALFVKVQLSEEPAWLRRAGVIEQLELMVEQSTPQDPKDLNTAMSDMSLENGDMSMWARSADGARNLDLAMADLALERGEKSRSAKSVGLVTDTIAENEYISPPTAPTAAGHMSVEGYEPKMDSAERGSQDEDGDWILE